MKRIDQKKRTYISPEARAHILNDPKITMLPIVFTKKLDKMESNKINWDPLSFKKITTMLLKESKPEYNPNNISTSSVKDMKSYNKLENKLKTYFQSSKSQYEELDLKIIIEMALKNIRTSTVNKNVQKKYSQSTITVKNETETWSSDDDAALVSVKKRKIDTPKDIDDQNQKKPENKAPNKSQKLTKSIAEILAENPIKDINEYTEIKKYKTQVNPKKDTTTVAEVQSQLKGFVINAPIENSKTVVNIDDKVLIKVKRRKRLSKDIDNEGQKKNQTVVPKKSNINTKEIEKNTKSNITENQSQKRNETKSPVIKQNECMCENKNTSPIVLPNTFSNIKKKNINQHIGGMSIFFFNTGLMAKQQRVAEERYDIGKDGTLEKFFVQSLPLRDFRRYSIEKIVCCLYKRAQVITEILNEYDISPTAINFLRAAHLCEVGACLCCCKPNRSAAQSDATLSSRILDRNVESSLISSNAYASSSDTSQQNQNVFATDKIMQNISAQYKLSIALKGLITSLLTNFKGITLTAGSTGKLSAVFNTTFTSWNNTDLQLMTTILTKIKRELFISQIPPKAFCDCVNEALNKDNVYCQASSLLSSKQLLIMKQYSTSYFSVENKIIIKPKKSLIEYFRGDLKLLHTSSNPGPSNVINLENQENKISGKQKTIKYDKGEKDELRKKPERGTKMGTKRKMRNKSPEALRECVFVPESTPEEPSMSENYDNTVPFKNPILQQLLTTSAPESADFGVTQIPLHYLVSVPVTENISKQVPLNNNPQTDNTVAIELSSDDETILP